MLRSTSERFFPASIRAIALFVISVMSSIFVPSSNVSTPDVAISYERKFSSSMSFRYESKDCFLSLQTHLPPFSLSIMQKESIQPLYFSKHISLTTVFFVAVATLVPESITFCVAPARADTVFFVGVAFTVRVFVAARAATFFCAVAVVFAARAPDVARVFVVVRFAVIVGVAGVVVVRRAVAQCTCVQ